MKILTLGLGAFGYAINKHLGDNNPNQNFYGYELNKDVSNHISTTKSHPFFFKKTKLSGNIIIIENYLDIVSDIDLLILAIPTEFIYNEIQRSKHLFKEEIIILNLGKGIDSVYNKTISQLISHELIGKKYYYAVLSGGMIASELINKSLLGADLGINDLNKGNIIKKLLNHNNLIININKNVIDIELCGSFKNILAIIVGYYQGKGLKASSIGYYFSNIINELEEVIKIYGGGKKIDFGSYYGGGDIIATCFGESRNRYFGELVGKGTFYREAINTLKYENKSIEGYGTLKNVHKIVEQREGFGYLKNFYEDFFGTE